MLKALINIYFAVKLAWEVEKSTGLIAQEKQEKLHYSH